MKKAWIPFCLVSLVAGAALMTQSCSSSPSTSTTETKASNPADEDRQKLPVETKEQPPANDVKEAPKEAPKEVAKEAPKAPAMDVLNPSTLQAKAPVTYHAKFTTTKGDFMIEATRDLSPAGADRLYNLIRGGFFTDAPFFRVLPGFVVQFGIAARPEVSRAWQGQNIPDEPVKAGNKRGTISFARAGRNTRSTQFFINLGDNDPLDTDSGFGFPVFAHVTEGMDVIEMIYSGYGQQPDQGALTNQGKAYVDRYFPRMDRILSTAIVP